MTDSLIETGTFTSSSGLTLPFKIECDALGGRTIAALAKIIADRIRFKTVEGVPSGGLMLAWYLRPYADPTSDALLIVDDVLTTGTSMELKRAGRDASGVVIFARGPCPAWVIPVFSLGDRFRP